MNKTNNKGITLVSLVITIIVMLILAGVSMSMVTGEGSVLDRAIEASEKQEIAAFTEELNLLLNDYNMASVLDSAKTNREDPNFTDYLEQLKSGGKIDTYTYTGEYLVSYKDKWFAVNKEGKSYTVSDNYSSEMDDSEANSTVVIAPSKVGSGSDFTIKTEDSGKTFIILDDVNVKDFNFDIPAGATISIKLAAKNMVIDNANYERSAINLNKGSTLNLYVYGNVTVNSGYGGAADGNKPGEGGYAGIRVPDEATLNLYGDGTLIAIGGNAGNGGTVTSGSKDQRSAGAGGGGAGAGIGGIGGKGGVYQSGVGASGGNGEKCGTVNIYDSLTVYAYGGAGGSGGRGDNTTLTAGGGGGYPAAGIGGGGAGGAGGTCCAGAGGYSGGAGDSDHVISTNGMPGANGVHCAGELLGGGGYFKGPEGVSSNGIDRTVATLGGFGNQGHWHNLSDKSGNGGTAGAGGTINVSKDAKVYAYNGNKYSDGTDYNNGQNQCPIYIQNGIKTAKYTYKKENKPLYNYFTLLEESAIDKTIEKSGYKNTKETNKITVNDVLKDVDMSLQGVGSGAGYIELDNGTYTIVEDFTS